MAQGDHKGWPQDPNSRGGKECRQTATTRAGGGAQPPRSQAGVGGLPQQLRHPQTPLCRVLEGFKAAGWLPEGLCSTVSPTAAADQGPGRQLSHAMAAPG